MKKESLIKKMILVLGLSATIISSSVAINTGMEMRDMSMEYANEINSLNQKKEELINGKDTYLDIYEASTTYKEQYGAIQGGLIADLVDKKICGTDFDREMEYLDSNQYTEELVLSSNEKSIKDRLNEINTQIDEVNDKIDLLNKERESYRKKSSYSYGVSACSAIFSPFATLLMFNYNTNSNNISYKKKEDEEAQKNLVV